MPPLVRGLHRAAARRDPTLCHAVQVTAAACERGDRSGVHVSALHTHKLSCVTRPSRNGRKENGSPATITTSATGIAVRQGAAPASQAPTIALASRGHHPASAVLLGASSPCVEGIVPTHWQLYSRLTGATPAQAAAAAYKHTCDSVLGQ
jgi:hypothetical protein